MPKKKFTVQNVGRPYAPSESIPENAWEDYSKHASYNAARKAISNYRAHLDIGSWDDHYRILDPKGIPV